MPKSHDGSAYTRYRRLLGLLNRYTDLYKASKSLNREMKQILVEIEEAKKALGIK